MWYLDAARCIYVVLWLGLVLVRVRVFGVWSRKITVAAPHIKNLRKWKKLVFLFFHHHYRRHHLFFCCSSSSIIINKLHTGILTLALSFSVSPSVYLGWCHSFYLLCCDDSSDHWSIREESKCCCNNQPKEVRLCNEESSAFICWWKNNESFVTLRFTNNQCRIESKSFCLVTDLIDSFVSFRYVSFRFH